jgi:hypothetical protein
VKITVPLKAFDVMGLLNAAADFHIRLCGHEDSLFAYLGTEKQRPERYLRVVAEIFEEEAPFPDASPDTDTNCLYYDPDGCEAGVDGAACQKRRALLSSAGARAQEQWPCNWTVAYSVGGLGVAWECGSRRKLLLLISHPKEHRLGQTLDYD